MPDRDKIIAIMDDLLLHSTRDAHMSLLVNLFETMIKNGLKLSPKEEPTIRQRTRVFGNPVYGETARTYHNPLSH